MSDRCCLPVPLGILRARPAARSASAQQRPAARASARRRLTVRFHAASTRGSRRQRARSGGTIVTGECSCAPRIPCVVRHSAATWFASLSVHSDPVGRQDCCRPCHGQWHALGVQVKRKVQPRRARPRAEACKQAINNSLSRARALSLLNFVYDHHCASVPRSSQPLNTCYHCHRSSKRHTKLFQPAPPYLLT